MAKNFDFGSISNFNNTKVIDKKDENEELDSLLFEISNKEKIVNEKKYFQTHIDPEILMQVDKIAKRTNHTRNDIVVKMIEFCVKNVKYK